MPDTEADKQDNVGTEQSHPDSPPVNVPVASPAPATEATVADHETRPRRAFFSFHYKLDRSRAARVRNMGVVEGNAPASDSDWESITKGGDTAIQKWIDDQLKGKSCVIVLIGRNTAGRKWINYEIKAGWESKKAVLGVYIHNLRDRDGNLSKKGANPFDDFMIGKTKLSSIIKAYDPPYPESKQVYACIKQNLAKWIENAIAIREKH